MMRLSGAVRDELEQIVRDMTPLEHMHAERFSAPGARLRGWCCSDSRLSYGRLSTADLTHARLHACNFNDLELTGVRMDGAYLSGSELLRVDLSDAHLEAAQLRDCRLVDVRLIGGAIERALLVDCRFSGCELTGASLSQALLISCSFAASQLKAGSLRGVDLRGACLLDIDLRHADLRGARFDGALLSGVDLRGARLDDVSWEGAALVRVRSETGSGVPASVGPVEQGGAAGGYGRGALEAQRASEVRPGWAGEPPETVLWSFLQRAPGDVAARLALELCRRTRLHPSAVETDFEGAAVPEGSADGRRATLEDAARLQGEEAGMPGGYWTSGRVERPSSKGRPETVRSSIRGGRSADRAAGRA